MKKSAAWKHVRRAAVAGARRYGCHKGKNNESGRYLGVGKYKGLMRIKKKRLAKNFA